MSISRTLQSYLVVGVLLAVAFTARGQSFRRAYGPQGSFGRDLVETTDGGFLIVGGAGQSLFLQRTQANGAVAWTNHLALNGAEGIAVCQAANGSFAVLAENYSDNGTLRNIVLNISASGAVLWQKILSNPSLANGFKDIVATADGGFALAGTGRSLSPTTDTYARLLKLDAAGDIAWDHNLGAGNASTELVQRLLLLPNGDLVLGGWATGNAPLSDGADFYLARCDEQGVLLWQQTYAKPEYQRAFDLLSTPDGGLVLLGESAHTDPVRMTLLKTDGNGLETWYKTSLAIASNFNPSNYRIVHGFTRDAAGNLYVPFQSSDGGSVGATSLLKLSAVGDSVWLHTSDLKDIPQSIIYTSDDQFAITGSSNFAETEFAALIKTDWLAATTSFYNTLSGELFWDLNLNCSRETGEDGPPEFIVEAENQFGEHVFQSADANGAYSIAVTTGDYTLTAHPIAGTEAFWSACGAPTLSVNGSNQNVSVPALGVQALVDCPYLQVELGITPLRRCTTTNYTAYYCNYGTAAATGAYVELSVSPLLTYVSSTLPLASQSGDTYRFDVGTIQPGDCDYFHVKFSVSCNAENGQTLCAEAHIYPDSSCTPANAQWDGSNLEVSASCTGNAEFRIQNTGSSMTGAVDYVILEDQIMYMQGQIQLANGADTTWTIQNPTGSSYYVRAEQRPGHPSQGDPAAVLDMCNGPISTSLALLLPLNQNDPFIDILCEVVTGSYDPNDKRGFPMGWRDEHYLEAGQEIDYMIRFQNTGTDTAFLVVVEDQLPPQLDPASVRPGAASHPYQFELSGDGRLRFTFGNILLPDSTTNEAASHGFVNFRVAQVPDLPDGTRIENEAAIYFDFNEPVVTEPWFHTIGQPLLSLSINPPGPGDLDLKVSPNPSDTYADFRIEHPDAGGQQRLSLYNSLGQLVRSEQFTGAHYRLLRNGMAPGLYYFRLENEQGRAASGKLTLK